MFSALRERNLALLFSGQIISLLGDFMLYVALPFWVYQLTGSALATGIMFAALTIPQLIVSPLAGVFVDRVDRRKLMIASDLLRAAIMLAYLTVNSADQVWIIYLLTFAESSVSQFFRPAVSAIVPTIVPQEKLAQANAALGASWAIGQLAGPAVGGVLMASFGPHGVAVVDAATYLVSALFIFLMRVPHTEHAAPQAKSVSKTTRALFKELLEGVRVVMARPLLRVVFASLGVLMLSQGIINVLIVVIVKELFGVGATELGWVMSAQGIGGIVGTVLIGAIAARVSPRTLVVASGVVTGVLLLAMMNQSSIYIAIALMLPLGIAVVAYDVGSLTMMQVGSDDANRGRVAALLHTVMAASQLLSIGITAAVADRIGAVIMLDFAALAFMGGGLIALLAPALKLGHATPSPLPQPAE